MATVDAAARAGAAPDARVHALDHLRALAMLAGVLFHAALAFSPLLQPYWPTADRQAAPSVDALAWLSHLVRMPLFFLVAGFFTAWLIARRGMGGLARQRVRRILLPLLVALPLVHLSMGAATEWAARHVAHPSAFLLAVRDWLALPHPPSPPPGTGHLWFLYYLLLFSVLAWVGRTLGWGAWLERCMARGPVAMALVLPLLLAPAFSLTSAPHPAPESLLPQFWAIGVFGPFFALGMALQGRLEWLAPLSRWLLPGVLACLALYVVFLSRIDLGLVAKVPAAQRWTMALLEAFVAAWGTLACLLAGLRWLARPNALLRLLSASAYWTYLVHLPVLFLVQYALMDLALAWPWKFALAVGVTLAVCLSTYALLVRPTPLRRFVG